MGYSTVHETATQFAKMLSNLSAICDKASQFADAKKIEVGVLLNSRLAPDQFQFIRQIQIATDTAKGMVARLSGQEPPKWEDNEATMAEVKARLKKTVDYLHTFKA